MTPAIFFALAFGACMAAAGACELVFAMERRERRGGGRWNS